MPPYHGEAEHVGTAGSALFPSMEEGQETFSIWYTVNYLFSILHLFSSSVVQS